MASEGCKPTAEVRVGVSMNVEDEVLMKAHSVVRVFPVFSFIYFHVCLCVSYICVYLAW